MLSQNDIIEMARQAGFNSPNPHDGYMGLAYDRREEGGAGSSLEAFAKLVAAKEREECALICENYADVDTYQDGIINDYHSHLIRLRGKE